ncbi:MAG: hypothetical protein ACE5GX_18430 [Thermoanaerobaculia bacterium]
MTQDDSDGGPRQIRQVAAKLSERALVVAAASALLGGLGCTAYSVPASLSHAERATVQAAEADFVAAIKSTPPEEVGDPEYYDSFRSSIRDSGLFSHVAFDWELKTEPDVTIEPLYRCNLEKEIGAVVPLFPLLTFGLVPMLMKGSYHWAFAVERHGERVTLDCPVRGTFAMGWVPWMLRVTPKWTDDAWGDPRTHQRVAYELAKALDSLPP